MHSPDRSSFSIAPPEPDLSPDAMLGRARGLIPLLRARQAECEAAGKVPDDVNEELIRCGFYRIIQPRRFGGYEFDVPTFYRVMMEIARGCPDTGWVVALTAGHPLIVASFPEEGQREMYGEDGEFRCPAAFNPPGTALRVDGGYRVSGYWVSASGCDHSTHFMGSALTQGENHDGSEQVIQVVLQRSQYRIVDDWHVMGMQGTGSKSVVAENVFVPDRRTIVAAGPGRGAEPASRPRIHDNPMYRGRILPFLVGEATAVAVGAARGALDLYEEVLLVKKTYQPPHRLRSTEPEFQRYYGIALGLVSAAEAALVRAGEEYMEYASDAAAERHAFDDARDQRITLVQLQCIRLAWEAVELIYRTVGTSDAAKEGKSIGRIFRCMAVINTHPALQTDRIAIAAAKTRFRLQ